MWEHAKAVIVENWNLKLLSLAFALVLYSIVHGGQDARGSISVDLEVNMPESGDKELASAIPRDVRIFVRGASQTIDTLRGGSVHVVLDLKDAPEHIVLSQKMVRLPDGLRVEVEQFDPPVLDFKWEPRITRDVPVQVSVIGGPADGFIVRGPLLAEPRTVKVRGPQSEVMVLQHVRTDAFDVRGIAAAGQYPRQLALESPNPRLKLDPARVVVTADVTREVAERVFQRVPVVVVGPAKGRALPSEVDVRLVCPPELVRSLRPEQIVPHVNVTSKDPAGSASLPIVVQLPNCEAFTTPRDAVARW